MKACRITWRFRWLFGVMMLGAASASGAVGGQGVRDSRDLPALPKSAGWLVQERDGSLLVGSGARIRQEPGLVDKVGSFLVGLGYGAPAFDSAGLSVMRFTPEGASTRDSGRAARSRHRFCRCGIATARP